MLDHVFMSALIFFPKSHKMQAIQSDLLKSSEMPNEMDVLDVKKLIESCKDEFIDIGLHDGCYVH